MALIDAGKKIRSLKYYHYRDNIFMKVRQVKVKLGLIIVGKV